MSGIDHHYLIINIVQRNKIKIQIAIQKRRLNLKHFIQCDLDNALSAFTFKCQIIDVVTASYDRTVIQIIRSRTRKHDIHSLCHILILY